MKVLFIIPTLGRPTLMASLQSLMAQTSDDWCALVVGDGIPLHLPPHPKIFTLQLPKMGEGRAAGNVRNGGIHLLLRELSKGDESKLPKPDYIGFLDDDDVLTPNYVELLTAYTHLTPYDVLVFRMNDWIEGILPPPCQDEIKLNRIGISFAVRRQVFEEDNFFVPSGIEDYTFLKALESKDKTIGYTKEVAYLVRPHAKTRRIPIQ